MAKFWKLCFLQFEFFLEFSWKLLIFDSQFFTFSSFLIFLYTDKTSSSLKLFIPEENSKLWKARFIIFILLFFHYKSHQIVGVDVFRLLIWYSYRILSIFCVETAVRRENLWYTLFAIRGKKRRCCRILL